MRRVHLTLCRLWRRRWFLLIAALAHEPVAERQLAQHLRPVRTHVRTISAREPSRVAA